MQPSPVNASPLITEQGQIPYQQIGGVLCVRTAVRRSSEMPQANRTGNVIPLVLSLTTARKIATHVQMPNGVPSFITVLNLTQVGLAHHLRLNLVLVQVRNVSDRRLQARPESNRSNRAHLHPHAPAHRLLRANNHQGQVLVVVTRRIKRNVLASEGEIQIVQNVEGNNLRLHLI